LRQNEQFIEMTEHLCSDAQPSCYWKTLMAEGKLKEYPLVMLFDLQKTEQSKLHHPEGNVWNHTCLVVDEAAKVREKSSDPTVFMWAALLHDIGKPSTTRMRRGRITAYDHDKQGQALSEEFLRVFTEDQELIQKVGKLVRYHMQPLFVLKGLPFAEVGKMKRETNLQDIALLSYCDRMGRTNSDEEEEGRKTREFLQKCTITPRNVSKPSESRPLEF
jgi:putative nucleotidyltransferase with HDIG domain